MDFESFLDLLRALDRTAVEYVLVGGVALNLYGIVRATEDIDLFVRPDPANVARLRDALRSLWEDDDIDGITAEDLGGEYPTIRYGPPDTEFAIDILSRLGTSLSFEDLDWETIDLEGVPVRIATPETLYRMKKNTVRSIDRADAEALRARFHVED